MPPDLTVNDLKGLIEADTNAPSAAQTFRHNDTPVTDTTKTLLQLGLGEGDLLQIDVRTRPQTTQRRAPQPAALGQAQPGQNPAQPVDPERLRQHILSDNRFMERVRNDNPALAETVQDPARFRMVFQAQQQQLQERQKAWEEEQALLNSDPNDLDAQRRIYEMIQQQQISRNLETAMEETPEAFARVTMLYIDVVVNNVPIKAFVDSGAQSTIMSPDAAERCNISHLIDKRYSGMARGVGTAKILGRVHHAYVQLGQYQASSSFTVMEGKDVDLLLGLDMLKRHQMCIDLAEGCLRVQEDRIPFLPEHEIPKMMDEILEKEPKVEGPGGSTIGATTGTIEAPTKPSSAQSQQAGSSSVAVPRPAPQTASQPASQPSRASAFGQSQPITAQSIAQITELGFSREEAVAALQQVNGNVELAIGLLI